MNVPPLQPVCRAQPAAAVSHHEAVQVPSPMHAHRRVGAMLNASAVPQVVEQHHDQRVPPLGNVAMQAQAVKRLECAVQAARPAPAMSGPLLPPRLLLPLLLAAIVLQSLMMMAAVALLISAGSSMAGAVLLLLQL